MPIAFQVENFVVRTDSPQDAAAQNATRVWRWFVLVVSLTGLWIVGVGALSLLTANPVTLNRDQILESTDVVTAVVKDANHGDVRVEKSWKDVVQEDELELSNLRETSPSVGARLLIPVSSSRKGWRVTLSKLPGEPPLVYPVTEESERQLRQLLKNGRLP
ncbi:MAG: hypothetical protein FD138_2321 [Planctomycetota bacterium]|nr:MAG: hypothetical protein FD138_2321 [Planctomycetota bacterium]